MLFKIMIWHKENVLLWSPVQTCHLKCEWKTHRSEAIKSSSLFRKIRISINEIYSVLRKQTIKLPLINIYVATFTLHNNSTTKKYNYRIGSIIHPY